MTKYINRLTPFLVALYPCLFMYFNNIGEAYFKDIIPISLIYLFITFCIYIFWYILVRNTAKASFLTILSIILLMNFKSIEDFLSSIISSITYWHTIIILLFIVINVALFLKEKECIFIKDINKIIFIVYSLLLCFSIVTAIPNIINNMKVVQSNNKIEQAVNAAKKPNFYYFIFDEYAGPNNLKYFYDYSDELYKQIEKLKVNISYNSYNKDISTIRVVPDLFHLKSITINSTNTNKAVELMKNPPLYNILRNKGYDLNIAADSRLMDKENVKYVFSHDTSQSSDAQNYILKNSIIYPILNEIGLQDKIKTKLDLLNYLKYSYRIQENNLATLALVNLPHAPFYFKSDGSINDPTQFAINTKELYINQLKFTSKKIVEILDEIIKNDPESIILIQSDHGSRLIRELTNNRPSTDEELHEMKSILNILYYQGKTVQIDGLSGYDTLKLVVDQLLDGSEVKSNE